MRVTVSSHTRSHAFELVRQLARHQVLERFVSSDLRSVVEQGIPFNRILPLPWSSFALIPEALGLGKKSDWHSLRTRLHDRWAAHALGNPDIVVVWSGGSRHVLHAARDDGALTVLETTSSHAAWRDRVLRAELSRLGRPGGVGARALDAELQEYEAADQIMVSSQFARGTFLAEGIPATRLLLAPHGADLGGFAPGEKKDDIFRVLYIGQIGLLEGVAHLIEAFRELLLPRSELVLCGPVSADIEPVLRQHAGICRLLGAPDRARRAELLRQASVFVNASLDGGAVSFQREALASGVPVIATPESGAEESLRHGAGGFIVPSGDMHVLSDRLERLYRDRVLREELAGQAAATRPWTWDDYGNAVVACYGEALAARRTVAASVP